MKTALLGFVAALLLATPAFADLTPEQRFQGSFQDVMDAVSSDIEGIGDEDLTKDEKKALKALRKAQKYAGKLSTVGTDKKSLKTAGKIVKTLEKVADKEGFDERKELGLLLPAVQRAMSGLIGAIQYLVMMAEEEAEANQDDLDDSKNIEKVGKKLAKALAKAKGADEFWGADELWAKAWASYLKAMAGYVKAGVFAAKLYEKESKSGGGIKGVSFDKDGKIVNNSGQSVMLTDLIYDLTFKVPNAPGQTVKLKLSEINPGALPVDLGVNAFDPAAFSQVWKAMKLVPGISIKGKIVYQTTAGNLTFNF